MIKQHKKMLILTSVITLLPIFIGLLLWRQLPASVATHFGVDNQPDGYCSKVFANPEKSHVASNVPLFEITLGLMLLKFFNTSEQNSLP